MKLLLLRVSLTLLVAEMSCLSFGQTVTQQLNPEQIADRVSTVYGNDFVFNNPTLVTSFGKLLTQRIEYRVAPQTPDEKHPLLSSFPLMNKHNQDITPVNSETFSLEQFNPLTYNFGFFNDRTVIIRIDGTDYLMIVNAQ